MSERMEKLLEKGDAPDGTYVFSSDSCFLFDSGHSGPEMGVDRGSGAVGFLSLHSLSSSKRMALIEEVTDGGIFGIDFEIAAFFDKPNANFVRPAPGEAPKLADFSGSKPFLIDHDMGRVKSKVGTFGQARMESFGEIPGLVLGVTLRDPEEMIRILRDPSPEFSVRISSDSEYCSVCGTELERLFGWRFMGCDHQPGANVKVMDPNTGSESEKLVEVFMVNPQLVECSSVTKGAVEGTRPLSFGDWRNVMSDVKSDTGPTEGLEVSLQGPVADDATLLHERNGQLEAELADVRGSLEREKAAGVALAAELKSAQDEIARLSIDVAIHEGKMLPKDREYWLKSVSKFGRESLDMYLGHVSKETIESNKAKFGSGMVGAEVGPFSEPAEEADTLAKRFESINIGPKSHK